MYFPVGWPKQLQIPSEESYFPESITCNRERLLFAVLSEKTLSLWYCNPTVQLICLRRSDNSVSQFGTNKRAEWKPDSSMVAVVTSKSYILFYKVDIDTVVAGSAVFVPKEERKIGGKRDVVIVGDGECAPALKLTQAGYIQIPGIITSVVCLREELMVATKKGLLQRIKWDGIVVGDLCINLYFIPFATDLQHSRAAQLSAENEVFVKDLQYSSLMGGLAVVLSSGRAAFITASTLKFEPSQVVGVLATEMTNASCVAINHKYTLMAFGCESGDGVVYNLDELTGALQISHKLVVSSKDIPDANQVCGSVAELKWTPDSCALAMIWSKGGFSIWSVFGALLLCSVSPDTSILRNPDGCPYAHILSAEWGCEGYHLWLICEEDKPVVNGKKVKRQLSLPDDVEVVEADDIENTAEGETNGEPENVTCLMQMHWVKSALTVNPCMPNHHHLFLQGESKLYLSSEESVPLTVTGLPTVSQENLSMLGNRHWQVIPIPQVYLTHNWPIRYAAVNTSGQCVVVAGKSGFAHYALFTRKWKLFGNESQEHDMVVTGGLTWWKDFICTACYNIAEQRDEIRFYPRDTKLDNTFSQVVRVRSQIMLLNTFHDFLIVLCADYHVMIFKMERTRTQTSPSVTVTEIQEVTIRNFIPHPVMVVAITLTSLRTETAPLRMEAPPIMEAESMVINVAGRLFMFQRDRSGPQLKDTKERPLPFCAPVMIASNVENMWSCRYHNDLRPHLTEALWLSCGSAPMKVWLPLHPKEEGNTRSFMSKRIMLPFRVDIYPLAIIFEGGIILGVASDSLSFQSSERGTWPYMQLERTNQVYLHHILRQLLRRNLGVHALEVARSCKDLPYFPHILELLVHEVLEEEATSKEPIPDPLLPRVIAFCQEFPEYLQTVVHCARKTEVALWHYLFSAVGNPKDLFEECLVSKNLETAASYLIILQNLEMPLVSRQHATLLLEAALESYKWELARDLVRFLKAIDPSEAESPSGVRSRLTSTSNMYNRGSTSPPLSPVDNSSYNYSTTMRGRSISIPKEEPVSSKHAPRDKSKMLQRSDSQPIKIKQRNASGGSNRGEKTVEQFYIDQILHRHARKLLSSYCLRDLACFAANLEDYQLVQWLRREKLRAGKVDEFVKALKQLHKDFEWPLPIVTLHTLRRMASGSNNSLQIISASELLEMANGEDYDRHGGKRPASMPPVGPYMNSAIAVSADVFLQPLHITTGEDGSFATTELSDTSSALEDLDMSDVGAALMDSSPADLEQLSMELANKGSVQSQNELGYLLHIMLEACSLEWAMLISVLLRDRMAVMRTVNTASMTDTPLEMVARIREGLSYLQLWADTECYGYKPFFMSINNEVETLTRLVEDHPLSSKLNVSNYSNRFSSSSTESCLDSNEVLSNTPLANELQLEENVAQTENAVPEGAKQEEEGYECSIS